LASQGHLLNYFFHSWNQGSEENIAFIAMLYLRTYPNGIVQGPIHNSAQGHVWLSTWLATPSTRPVGCEKFIDILVESNQVRLLLAQIDTSPSPVNWIKACLEILINRNLVPMLFSLDDLVVRWAFIRNQIDAGERQGPALDQIVRSLVTNPDIEAKIMGEEFDQSKGWLYSSMARANLPDSARFSKWCEKGLAALAVETWNQELQSRGDLIQLTIDLCEKGAPITLGAHYFDSIAEQSMVLITGDESSKWLFDRWQTLQVPLPQFRKNLLREKMLDLASNAGGKTSDIFFDRCGAELSDSELLKQNNRVVAGLFAKLIDSRHEKGLTWLAGVFRAHGNFLLGYEPAYALQDFEDRVRGAIEKESAGPILDSIKSIADAMQILARPVTETAESKQDTPGPTSGT
jgi:hypothetical protein